MEIHCWKEKGKQCLEYVIMEIDGWDLRSEIIETAQIAETGGKDRHLHLNAYLCVLTGTFLIDLPLFCTLSSPIPSTGFA